MDISEGLARVACAGEINGEEVDLRTVVDSDCELNILTFDSEGGKAAFRHTASHIMAQAIKRLYPETKLAIGPSIKDGFYYDVDRETPFTSEDLEKIEAEMNEDRQRSPSAGAFHNDPRRVHQIHAGKRRTLQGTAD